MDFPASSLLSCRYSSTIQIRGVPGHARLQLDKHGRLCSREIVVQLFGISST